MAEPKFIDKKEVLPEGLDYQFLKKKGIEHIQRLAGENWTDFNVHDPGVTILEQLAYALTDLGYRSNLEFVDLLASQKNPNVKDTAFPAKKILTSNPLTVNDFRKIILDRVQGVQNIWMLPLNSFTRRKNIKGLYLALLQIDPKYLSQAESVKQEVKKVLNHYSNLGEAFEDVIILDKQEVYVQCQIELDKNAIAEEVHARVMVSLDRMITRPMMYYSLNEMLDSGYEVDKIFEGPRLDNGFIVDQHLREKDSVLFNSQLLNELREIEGIKTIKFFNLVEEVENEEGILEYKNYFDELGQERVNEVVVVKWDSIPVLGSKMYQNANHSEFINYSKDGVPIHLFQKDVDRYIKGVEAKVKLRYSHNMEQDIDFKLPEGTVKPIRDYYSLQHQFPKFFGLSKEGISSNTPNSRKAQIFQLKAYLMFFEQVMTNFLEQLSRFNELYSLERSLDQSYFVEAPWDIPQMYQLVSGVDVTSTEEEFQNKFRRSVESIMQGIDDFHDRRIRFIRHLLARFGDNSYQFSFERFNYYHSKEEHRNNTINRYLDVLENYDWLSRNKSRSFDHTRPLWNKSKEEKQSYFSNLSTLESRIRLELGLPLRVNKVASDLFPNVAFDGSKQLYGLKKLAEEYSDFKFWLMGEPLKGIWMREEEHGAEMDPEWLEGININDDIFKRGIWQENLKVAYTPLHQLYRNMLMYKCRKEEELSVTHSYKSAIGDVELERLTTFFEENPEQESLEVLFEQNGESLYVLEFTKNDRGEFIPIPSVIWKVLKTFDTEDEAFKCAFSLKNHLLKWNQESEGFYVLDHVLLRPRKKDVEVNILLNDPTSDWSFRLTEGYHFSEVEEGIKNDILAMRMLPYQVIQRGGQYLIVWSDDKRIIGRCNQKFASELEAQRKAEEIKEYFVNFTDFDVHDATRVKFKREVEDNDHPLHHYSFTITVLLTSWTARFSDPEFRYLLETVFRKHTPAHIGIHFKWVGLEDMTVFEQLYDTWLEENRREEVQYGKLNFYSGQLLNFIKNVEVR